LTDASSPPAPTPATLRGDPEADSEVAASNGVTELKEMNRIVGYVLRRAQLALFEDFARRFKGIDLTPAQFSTLVAIRENPERRQSDIAAALGIQRPNFVALMDNLERRGLAERVRSGADRRSNALALTTAGAALLERAMAAQAEQETAIRARIGEPERLRLLDTLQRLTGI
jgi:DNA-binding MarR family transcriptional regulator